MKQAIIAISMAVNWVWTTNLVVYPG